MIAWYRGMFSLSITFPKAYDPLGCSEISCRHSWCLLLSSLPPSPAVPVLQPYLLRYVIEHDEGSIASLTLDPAEIDKSMIRRNLPVWSLGMAPNGLIWTLAASSDYIVSPSFCPKLSLFKCILWPPLGCDMLKAGCLLLSWPSCNHSQCESPLRCLQNICNQVLIWVSLQ